MRFEDLEALVSNWIKVLSKEEHVPANIKALNFGMFESENGYVVHMYGSEEYDPKDDAWSYNEDYVPKNRCLEFEQKEIKEMHWEDFQSSIVKALKNILDSNPIEEIKIFKVKNITTGFDDGDLINIK